METAALERSRRCQFHLVADGATAMHFLNRTAGHVRAPNPDLLILNIGLRRESGLEVLSAIKGSQSWGALPVVAMTTADPEAISQAYALHANCCVVRPADALSFMQVINSIEHFWTTVAKLPTHH
jgi:CheY-like chemotaxis protein